MNSLMGSSAKKPVIRREKVMVKKPVSNSASPQPGAQGRAPPANRFQLSATPSTKPKNIAAQRALAPSRGLKRKSATPQPAGPMFSDDEGEDENSSDVGASDSDASRKRIKSSVSSVESTGPRRTLASETVTEKGRSLEFVQASTLTSKGQEKKYKNAFGREETTTVSLRYPSKSPLEKFQLKFPKSSEDYKPMEDIVETIKHICQYYLPEELGKYVDEEDNDSFPRQLNRAWNCESVEDFEDTVRDFNRLIKPLVEDGTLHGELKRKTHMPLPWVKRILDQTYARTVSPRVETLKAYKNGSDNVYGELLPDFVSEILRKTRLNHEQTFVDLGSGVGNVVLQAALEVGAESWGIEMMPNPCELADLQAEEFPARAKLWGLNVGKVHLLRGDFTSNPRIGEVLKKADVVLVNNQAFTAGLNDTLLSMFLDLKEGCQVVSLKPFVPVGHKISMRNIDSPVNMFVQREEEYFSNRVSWTDRAGTYYYATKDSRPLRAFQRRHNV